MKVKGAYYAPALPSSVVVVLPDDTVWMTNDAPFRILQEKELTRLPAYETPAYKRTLFTPDNEISTVLRNKARK